MPARAISYDQRQSLFDLAIQHVGFPEAAFDIAMANGLSVTDTLAAGGQLVIPDMPPGKLAGYYKANNIVPATGISDDDYSSTIASEGVEFWAIEFDFLVS